MLIVHALDGSHSLQMKKNNTEEAMMKIFRGIKEIKKKKRRGRLPFSYTENTIPVGALRLHEILRCMDIRIQINEDQYLGY